jgi:DNA-nicking Smr family endonuclease
VEKEKSIYNLFSDLRDFVKGHSISLSPPAEGLPDPVPGNGKLLFREAMEGVKKMRRGKGRVREQKQTVCLGPLDDQAKLEETLKEDYTFNVVDLPEYMEGRREDINPLTMEKLRAGEYSAQKTLDLHGYGVEEAYAAFQGFIRDAVMENIRCIKVIHGRGLKSPRGPVLKEKLKEWIVSAMHRKWVIAFASCIMREGGPGTTIILLKREPEKGRLHIIG